jgi:nitroimidazol reductase NimA-like FMN-containing flavoprotein (pyridoxamine 5'-phosphate oxidase superfamily)
MKFNMRRSDREITEHSEIVNILQNCDTVRIGFANASEPYIVPMSFGIEDSGGALTLWFHSAKEGRKLDMLRSNPRVCFEADCAHALIAAEDACGYGMDFDSVIGYGVLKICSDAADKRKGLLSLMTHYAPKREFSIPDAALGSVAVLRLDVEELTGKRHSSAS